MVNELMIVLVKGGDKQGRGCVSPRGRYGPKRENTSSKNMYDYLLCIGDHLGEVWRAIRMYIGDGWSDI